MKTTVPFKGGYMGFHVSLGECSPTEAVTEKDTFAFGSGTKPYTAAWMLNDNILEHSII